MSNNDANSLPPFLEDFSIQYFFQINDIHVKGLGDKKEVYFLGDNGDGKTLLLQGLFFALSETSNRRDLSRFISNIETQPLCNFTAVPSASESNNHAFNVLAYGVHRRDDGLNYNEDCSKTLFRDDAYLRDYRKSLLEIDRLNLRKAYVIPLDNVMTMLEDCLRCNVHIQNGRDITFTQNNSSIQFCHLPESYKSTFIWLVDMLSRLIQKQPKAKHTGELHGIVLVDEIGMHLSNEMQFQIVKRLREWLPNVQFIFTTHSDNLSEVSKDAILFNIYKSQAGDTKVSKPFSR